MVSQAKTNPGSLDKSEDEIELSSLMKKSLEGDSQSYVLLLQRVKDLMNIYVNNSLRKFSLASLGAQEDVVQEILLAIHSKRSTYDTKQFFLPWMYAIARYKTIDFLRKNKVSFRSVSIEDSLAEFEISESSNLTADIDIESLCAKLPDKQREILMMVKVEGLSIAEAAARTGFSVSDVKVTIHRAIKELQKYVKDAGHEN